MLRFPSLFRIAMVLMLLPVMLRADNLQVAVASNFAPVLQDIGARFEAETGHTLTLIPGATGLHYTQIINGAPFDVYLAADSTRPALLLEQGHGLGDTRFTYAIGKLLLWSADPALVDNDGEVLRSGTFRYLALANPRLAPYGSAAQEVLSALGLWNILQQRLVQGENITQTLQFVQSANAELGFIAKSQWLETASHLSGSHWEVPQALYTPLTQQGLLLKDSPAGRAFIAYLQNDGSRQAIEAAGYELP